MRITWHDLRVGDLFAYDGGSLIRIILSKRIIAGMVEVTVAEYNNNSTVQDDANFAVGEISIIKSDALRVMPFWQLVARL